MACRTENELVQYADASLAPELAREVKDHVGECDACRRVLAAIAADDPEDPKNETTEAAIATVTKTTLDAPPEEPKAGALPAELLARYLTKDAPAREQSASRIVLVLSAAGLVLPAVAWLVTPADVPLLAFVLQGAIVAYELLLLRAMKRGWFHPAVPVANSLLEVSIAFIMLCGVAITHPAEVLTTPWLMLQSAVIVFTAVRADPRICLAAGALAGVEQIALYLMARGRAPQVELFAFSSPGVFLRVVLCMLSGVAGATLARHFVRRAREALREIREQDMFGKYALHERLGGGGMGEVFRATYCPEGGFVREVAVKRMRADLSDDPTFAEAFRREAELSARLAHPNLVQVLDCGRFRGAFVFVMEYVDGMSLARLLRLHGGPLPPRAVAFLGAELALALDYVHRRPDAAGRSMGLVHQDLNPPNVMLSRIGEVKLADFGVARVGEHDASSPGFSGKLQYAAPEQLAGGPVDGRTDLYALGLTLHEALTGKRVFATSADSATTCPIVPPADVVPSVPKPLSDLIMRLLAEDPAARTPDAAAVRSAFLGLDGDLAPYPEGAPLLAGLLTKNS